MVFGLNVRPVYGHYPRVESLDDRFDKHFSLKPKFRPEPPMKDGKMDYGAMRRELPNRMKWKDTAGRQIPDFDQTPTLNVSERAKAVIESVEPGVHEFEPVEYEYSRGGRTETRFWLRIGNKIDTLDREHTNMVLHLGNWRPAADLVRLGIPIPQNVDPNAPPKMVFNLAQVGNAHIWHDKHLSSGSRWISDRMAQAFLDAGLTGIEPGQADAV